MLTSLYVALGGALGSVARFWFSVAIATCSGSSFPYGTLLVNVVGSFVIGVLQALSLPEGRFLLSPPARVFFMIGVCGGFTTFSSFSLQTYAMALEGQWLRAAANTVLSVVLCLVAVALGQLAVSVFNRG